MVVAEGFGSWVEFIAFLDNDKKPEVWWTIDMHKPDWHKPSTGLLESDSGLRGDSQKLREKDVDAAEVIKCEMEERQRKDKALRTAAKERREKKK